MANFNIPQSMLDEETNDTQVVTPTVTAPISEDKASTSFNIPESLLTTEEPTVTDMSLIVSEQDRFNNQDYEDMQVLGIDVDKYKENTLSMLQEQYRANIEAELEDDPTSPYLIGELEREDDPNSEYLEALQLKTEAAVDRLFSPERLKDLRVNAEIQWAERQELLKKFEPYAKSQGYEDTLQWIWDIAENDPKYESYLTTPEGDPRFVPETKQEFFNRRLDRELERIDKQAMTVYQYLNGENIPRKKGMEIFLKSDMNLGEINTLQFAKEFVDPSVILGDVNVEASRFSRMFEQGDVMGMLGAATMTTLNILTLAPPVNWVKNTGKGFRKWIDNSQYVKARQAIEAGGRREAALRAEVRKKLAENRVVADEFAEAFESKFDVSIFKEVDGKKVIDKEALLALGQRKTQDLMSSEVGTKINLPEDAATMAILKPETLEGLIGAMIDIKKIMPEEFGKRKTRIDDMLHLVMEQKLKPDDLMGILAKNGLTFEEFIVSSYGTVSEAGSILGTWGRISKVKPKGLTDDLDSKIKIKKENVFSDLYTRYFLRSEAIAKGALVAPFAVAVRNFKSGVIRAPMESLNALLSNTMLEFQRQGIKGGAKALVPYTESSVWTGTLDNLKYMFADPRSAKAFSEYILAQSPDHQRQIYTTLNEIQLNLGRSGASRKNNPIGAVDRVFDTMMSDMEDLVAVLNTPNRVQELLIRNATFYGELKRLVKREYGIDFEGALNEGKLMDFIRDAETVRPKNARAFSNLIDDSARKALRVTYSAQPENIVLRKTAEMISKSPATLVIPFPRFIANGIEYFGELAAGSASPLGRKLYSLADRSVAGPLTPRETERIANNMIGIGLFMGLYSFQRDQGDRGENYQEVGIPFTDLETNVLADYPVGQMNWIVRAAVERNKGTFDDWDAKNDWVELFLVPQGRTGVTNVLVEEFSSMISGLENEPDEAKRDLLFGKIFGQYVTRFANPLFQVVEAERAMGFRTTERKQSGTDFLIDDPQFQIGATRQAISRGLVDPDYEDQLPRRETVTNTGEERRYIWAKLLGGTSLRERNETLDYLSEIGMDDPKFTLGSRHKIYSVRDWQDSKVGEMLPSFIRRSKREGIKRGSQWDKSESLQKKYEREQYVRLFERDSLMSNVRDYRNQIGDGRALVKSRLVTRTNEYMKLPKSKRKAAEAEFIRRYGKKGDIDYSDYRDIERLLMLAGRDIKPKK